MGQLLSSTQGSRGGDRTEILLLPMEIKEQRHFEEVYTRFEEGEKFEDPPYCIESTLIHFLKLRAPAGLDCIVEDAGPLLYRTVLRLGSYPYHLDPEDKLTIDVLRTAVVLVLSKYRFRGWNGEKEDINSHIKFLEKKSKRLLFQSMMQDCFPDEKNPKQRSDEDDEDLLEVLQALDESGKGRKEVPDEGEKKGCSMRDLPSSHSTELRGFIPYEEFRRFVRLMVLYRFPFNLTQPSLLEIDATTDTIMEWFTSKADGASVAGITWPAFDQALGETMPYLTRGLFHLFTSFIQPPSSIQKSNLSTAEVWSFPLPPKTAIYKRRPNIQLGQKCPPDPDLPPIPYNPKMSFEQMALLAMCIPSAIDVRYHLQQSTSSWQRPTVRGSRNSLMFISATRIPTTESKDNSKLVICGFKGRWGVHDGVHQLAGPKLFIQLAPVYRVFAAAERPVDDLGISRDCSRGWFSLWCKHERSVHVKFDDNKGRINIVSFEDYVLGQPRVQKEVIADDEFSVDEIKLFCFRS